MPFDPAKFAEYKRRVQQKSTGFDPTEFEAAKRGQTQQVAGQDQEPGFLQRAARGMLTTGPTQGFAEGFGRAIPATGGGMIGGAKGAAIGTLLGPWGTLAGGIIGAGLGGGSAELARTGYSDIYGAATGGPIVPTGEAVRSAAIEGAAQSGGQLLGLGLGGFGSVLRDAAARSLESNWLGKLPYQALERAATRPGQVMAVTGEPAAVLPPATSRVRDLVHSFEKQIGDTYKSTQNALLKEFGPQHKVDASGLRQEMYDIMEKMGYEEGVESNAAARESLLRLVNDATRHPSLSVKSAIKQSQRFTPETTFLAGRPIERPADPVYDATVKMLRGAFDSRLESGISKSSAGKSFLEAKQAYAGGRSLAEKSKNLLNSLDLSSTAERAEGRGNLNAAVLKELGETVPGMVQALEQLQDAVAGSYMGRPISQLTGGAWALGHRIGRGVKPFAQAAPRLGAGMFGEPQQ